MQSVFGFFDHGTGKLCRKSVDNQIEVLRNLFERRQVQQTSILTNIKQRAREEAVTTHTTPQIVYCAGQIGSPPFLSAHILFGKSG